MENMWRMMKRTPELAGNGFLVIFLTAMGDGNRIALAGYFTAR
jgi:hypothetical protein